MSFTLDMLFELLPEYHFSIKEDVALSRQYKSIHLLPVDSAELNPDMVYITDFYDMERFQKFCDAHPSNQSSCLIFVYEQDEQYAPGASVYLKEEQEMAVILNRMQETITDIMLLERNLIDAVMQAQPMEDILAPIGLLLKNPVAVLDPTLRLLAHWEEAPPADPLYQSLMGDGFLSEEWSRQLDDLRYFTHQITPEHPYALCPPDGVSPQTRICYAIPLAPSVYAAVYCVAEKETYSGSLLAMLELFMPHIRSKLVQLYAGKSSPKYDPFLLDLLSREDLSESEIRSRAYALRIPFRGSYVLLATGTIRNRTPVTYFLNQIHLLFPTALTVIWENRVVILLRQGGAVGSVQTQMTPLFREYGYQGGISPPFSNLTDVHLAFEQAHSALEISLQLQRSPFIREFALPVPQPPSQIFEYAQISTFHACTLACRQVDFRSFCVPQLFSLIASARKNNSAVIQVLYTYLITGCSYVATAERLHMHRNNVVYHIRRLKESEGLNLEDHLVREKLLLTFSVLFLQEDGV